MDESTVFESANDSNIYELNCPKGHRTTVVVIATRHEQLFEIALSAILDKYYREAVSSFAASLERFYEFATGVLARDLAVPDSAFGEAWKPLAKQSERQLGAFIIAFLLTEKSPPKVLASKAVELRNDVVHKGRIPTEDQAIWFGDAVLDVIRSSLAVLQAKHPAALHNHSMALHLEVLSSSVLKGKKVTRHSLAMALRDLETEEVAGRDTKFYLWRLSHLHRRQ